MNFLNARVRDDGSGGRRLVLDGGGEMDVGIAAGNDAVEIGIRPEHVELIDAGIPMTVSLCEQLGGNSVLHGKIDGGQPMVVQTVGQSQIKRGEVVHVRLPAAACHVFDRAGKTIVVLVRLRGLASVQTIWLRRAVSPRHWRSRFSSRMSITESS